MTPAELSPAHDYSDTYRTSPVQVEFTCPCHPGIIAATGERTGLRAVGRQLKPVYRLHSWTHLELNGVGVVLSDGKLTEAYRA